jgi:isopentenyldiphosphate isomerase
VANPAGKEYGVTTPEKDEIFDLVDEQDRVLSRTTRTSVHGNPALIHRVAHVLVFNSRSELFLQKRSATKDVQPGRWDTSVGGHVASGETYAQAAIREMTEELGISCGTASDLRFLHKYLHRNSYESEYVCTFRILWDGDIRIDPVEIDEGRFWSLDAIAAVAETGIFTPNFLDEFHRYKASVPAP